MSQSRQTTQDRAPHPTRETTREEFLSDRTRASYRAAFRLTQTERVSGQVGIHELVEFAEEVRWLAQDEYNIPIEYWNVTDHDVSITLDGLLRHTVDDRGFEADVEELAEEHDIGLCKLVGLHRTDAPHRYDGGVFVKYSYGWGRDNAEDSITDPYSPQSRVKWVGGFRGQPETMTESTIRITEVRSTAEPSLGSKMKRYLSNKWPL